MAGMGKRMRPHTLTVPKPLIPVAGKPIVQRLVEEIASVSKEKIEEIAFITGHFGEETEKRLISIAENLGAKGTIYYQDEPLGTAHAVLCAADSLQGKTIVAFADTLFKATFTLSEEVEGSIWVKTVENPSSFGVVTLSDQNFIQEFVEKPKKFVSDLAIIGIYYFKDGENLRKELQFLVDNNIAVNGEYQLTDALENMKNKGLKFVPGKVDEWLDCGNKDATVYTNGRILEHHKNEDLIAADLIQENSIVLEPCFIGKGVRIENSIIGPYASIGQGCTIRNCIIKDAIIQNGCNLNSLQFSNSMLGNFVEGTGKENELNLGDYTVVKI